MPWNASRRWAVIPARSSVVTSEQSAAAGLFTCAAATSASRTCAVRSHTPPVSTTAEPSTLCAASAATASWSRNAGAS